MYACNTDFGKTQAGYRAHAIRQVHSNASYLRSFLQRYLVDNPGYVLWLGAFDHRNDSTLLTMSCLVMKDSVDIVTDTGFVNTKTRSQVLRFKYPFLSMVLLIPVPVVAQNVLVVFSRVSPLMP